MKTLVFALCSAALLLHATAAAEPSYGDGYEPTPPAPFPAEYKDYQILPGTISPDQRYAFIYTKRSLLYEEGRGGGLTLVALKPFKVLGHFDTGNNNLAGKNYYAAEWSKDSSTTVFVAGAKWGAEKVWLARITQDQVESKCNLTAGVRQAVIGSFKKSGAPRYNPNYDFIFEDDPQDTSGWKLDNQGRVLVNTICTTDPKEIDDKRWAVRFTGTWDISKQSWIQQKTSKVKP